MSESQIQDPLPLNPVEQDPWAAASAPAEDPWAAAGSATDGVSDDPWGSPAEAGDTSSWLDMTVSTETVGDGPSLWEQITTDGLPQQAWIN